MKTKTKGQTVQRMRGAVVMQTCYPARVHGVKLYVCLVGTKITSEGVVSTAKSSESSKKLASVWNRLAGPMSSTNRALLATPIDHN